MYCCCYTVVFRFAKDGFFSKAGGASFLVIYGIVFKFFYGIRVFMLARGPRYLALKRSFGEKKIDDRMINGVNNGTADDAHL